MFYQQADTQWNNPGYHVYSVEFTHLCGDQELNVQPVCLTQDTEETQQQVSGQLYFYFRWEEGKPREWIIDKKFIKGRRLAVDCHF